MKPLTLIHDKPLIWAHRGGRSLAAENTLLALRKAHEVGAHGWETDVQLTKDGEVIILHDLNLLRTTNAGVHPAFRANRPTVPWRFTLEEIRQLSAATFPRRFCGVSHKEQQWKELPEAVKNDLRVPTLAEALQLTKKLGLWINIEIKDISKAVPAELEKTIVDKVHQLIAAEGMEDQVIISSFNHDYIRKSKECAPHILTGALTKHAFAADPLEAVQAAKADAWHPGYRFLTSEAVERVREAGLAVNPYTVNDAHDMTRLAQWGVSGIVTDHPQDVPF